MLKNQQFTSFYYKRASCRLFQPVDSIAHGRIVRKPRVLTIFLDYFLKIPFKNMNIGALEYTMIKNSIVYRVGELTISYNYAKIGWRREEWDSY